MKLSLRYRRTYPTPVDHTNPVEWARFGVHANTERGVRLAESAAERARAGDLNNALGDVAEAVRCMQLLLHDLITVARAEGRSWQDIGSSSQTSSEYLEAAHADYDPQSRECGRYEKWRPLG